MTRLTVQQARQRGILQGQNKPKKQRKKQVHITQARWDAFPIEGGVCFVLPFNMPSLNEWKDWHWGKQRDYKKQLTEDLEKLRLLVGRTLYAKARVEVTHYFRVVRNRDSGDNFAPKFLLDALRYAGVIAEDNSNVLQVPEPVFKIDRQAWRTEVRVLKN